MSNKSMKLRQVAKILSCLVLIFAMLAPSLTVFAEDPYQGYNYTYYDWSASPNAFLPEHVYNATEWGDVGYMKDPQDMYVDKWNNIYILDTGNARIIKLNENFEFVSVIDNFTLDGEPSPLSNPQGVCVTPDGEVYIADTGNNRVIVTDQEGTIKRSYDKPETEMLADGISFEPTKIEVLASGDMYVLEKNTVNGALIITEDDQFLGFFGTETVALSGESLQVLFYRLFMTDEQIAKMLSLQPVPFNNMYLDGDFLYTATIFQRDDNQIRKVNPSGLNLYDGLFFGEGYYDSSVSGGYEQAAFVDVTVDDNEFVYALDRNFGKVFMYNQEGILLAIFGKQGEADGQISTNPTAIEAVGDKVMVLDATKDTVTVYKPTYFGEQIILGSLLYDRGKYTEALEPWQEVVRLNGNYELAYRGIAQAQYLMGDYKSAVENFRLAYDRDGYSEARQKYRAEVVSENFTVGFTVIVVVIILLIILSKQKEKIRKKLGIKTLADTGYAGMSKFKYPFYNMMHPHDGMTEMKYNKKASLPLAIFFVFAWYAASVIMRQYEDFVFNGTNTEELNILIVLGATVGLLLIGCASNWAICTLLDGKGTFKDIFTYAGYAMIPSAIAPLIVTVISHYMIQDEAVFVLALLWGGYIWTSILMFKGTQVVHDFTFKKTCIMLLLTGVGMIVILFLLMLLAILFQQVFSFGSTIFYEIFYRFISA